MTRVAEVSAQSFQILLSLAGGRMHGYALMKEIEERTDGGMRLTASTLYGAIQRMLEAGWIEEVVTPASEDSRRRTYGITRSGRQVARAEATRMADLVSEARRRKLLNTTS